MQIKDILVGLIGLASLIYIVFNLGYSIGNAGYALGFADGNASGYKQGVVSCDIKMVSVREFASISELRAWLAMDKTNQLQYIEESFDCDDFARTLQKAALEDGYLLNVGIYTIADDPETPDVESLHAMNMAIISGEIILIEPQTDEYYKMGPLDQGGGE